MIKRKAIMWLVLLGCAAFLPTLARAATFIVNDTGDATDANIGDGICSTSGAVCTLRAALDEANALNDSDTITFDPVVFPPAGGTTINTTSELLLNDPVTITGPGADALTVSNNASSRVFRIDHGLPVTGPHEISGMTITGGDGGIQVEHIENDVTLDSLFVTANTATTDGGGIFVGPTDVFGTVFIQNCTISGNSASFNGGGVASSAPLGSVTITKTAIAQNTAHGGDGGGIFNSGGSTMTIENSTIFGNSAGDPGLFIGTGGGIRNGDPGSSVSLTNSTVSGNFSATDGGGISNSASNGSNTVTLLNVTVTGNTSDSDFDFIGAGGGINQADGAGTFTVTNSIIAGNISNSFFALDCQAVGASLVESGGNNLIGDIEGCFSHTFDPSPTKNDQVGDSFGAGVIDPMLSALIPSDGGNPAIEGPTGVHIPLPGSPAIDTIADSVAPAPPKDQRGVDRPFGPASDRGSVEVSCGNGTVETGEDCDSGVDNSDTTPDACRTSCTFAVCGDGVMDTGEACDDAGESATCNADCTEAVCGDGVLNATAGEKCDDGAANSDTTPDACRTTCLPAHCGDTIVDTGETCDDGNIFSADGCNSVCKLEAAAPAICGDGILDAVEECDDGNKVSGDGCSFDCKTEVVKTNGGCSLIPSHPF